MLSYAFQAACLWGLGHLAAAAGASGLGGDLTGSSPGVALAAQALVAALSVARALCPHHAAQLQARLLSAFVPTLFL